MIEGRSRQVLWGVFLSLMIAGFLLVATSVRTTFPSWYVTQQPEAFTELAFSRYIPEDQLLTAGRSYPLPFLLTNREGVTTIYTLETLVTAGSGLQSRHLETLRLKNGERADRSAFLTIPLPEQHFQITVLLRFNHITQTIFARFRS